MPSNQQDIVFTISGILLPKENEQWNLTNDYFKSVFIDVDFSSDSIDSINGYVNLINKTIYRYFKDNYGTVKSDVEQVLVPKNNTYSVHSLKKALKRLKLSDASLEEIQYVSRLLRSKLQRTSLSSITSSSHKYHDRYISKKFWGFLKNIVDKPLQILASFSGEECTNFFAKCFLLLYRSGHFLFQAGFQLYNNYQHHLILSPRLMIRSLMSSGG